MAEVDHHDPHHNRKRAHTEEEKKPVDWDRAIDHSRPHIAEAEARNAVRKIIQEGGNLLHEHYLQHKAFAFAATAAMERSVCSTEMCFVACEDAEPEDTFEEDWGLEPEPEAQRIDSWAGMVIPKRTPESVAAAMADKFGSTKGSNFDSRRTKRGTKQAAEVDMPVKKEKTDAPRSWSIEDKKAPDAEEERFREAKQVDDNKRREMEKMTRDRRQAESEARKRIEELHEEMDKRPHTFDLNGEVLWVEPPKVDKLPKVQETVEINIKRNLKPKTEDNAAKQPDRSPKKAKAKRKNAKIEASEQFPDTFVPLSHGQPPILETMQMKMGVSLQHKGKNKPGPPRETIDGKMSRREFASQVAREISGDTQLQFTVTGSVRPFGGNSGKLPQDDSPKSKSPAARKDLPKAEVAGSDKTGGATAQPMATRSDSLPEIAKDKGRAPPAQGSSLPSQGAKGIDAAHGGKRSPEMERAPLAPPMYTRMQKTYEALGYVARNPRVHAPSLGKLNVVDHGYPKATQPPLGATMGHGLMRFSTSQEEFYFPSTSPEPPNMGMMNKSKSDTALPRDAKTLLLGDMAAPIGNDAGARSPVHGNIVTDSRSPTYKNVRKQMFPGKAE